MKPIASTPQPPYYAVIFASLRSGTDEGYADTAAQMMALASEQPGFLGVESVREEGGAGITVSYWKDKKAIREWKNHAAHQQAQRFGKEKWYRSYKIRVSKVMKDYGI
ncbi:MAG: antibiotic biosynthesis monooxygenase [Deltaproteobacteria bacterium]|jgi:heme-degrading monooxygenase HmoA|nr:antibiotic biosynthesis monooxygenase [Deltaproteobacteria bacterium]MBW2480784.1 antibiotic biosynthesis monooxygenase [Deltaproteobacteria bacterium]